MERSEERGTYRCHTKNFDFVCGYVRLKMLPMATFWSADLTVFSKTLYKSERHYNCHEMWARTTLSRESNNAR